MESSYNCEVCEIISQQLEDFVMENKTQVIIINIFVINYICANKVSICQPLFFQSEIKETLEAICSLLPITSYRNDCDVIIERYLSKIIENSVNAVSPEQFCSTLKICPEKHEKVLKEFNFFFVNCFFLP